MNKQNQNRLKDTETRLMAATGEGGWRTGGKRWGLVVSYREGWAPGLSIGRAGAKHITNHRKGIHLFLCPLLSNFRTWKSAGPRGGPRPIVQVKSKMECTSQEPWSGGGVLGKLYIDNAGAVATQLLMGHRRRSVTWHWCALPPAEQLWLLTFWISTFVGESTFLANKWSVTF